MRLPGWVTDPPRVLRAVVIGSLSVAVAVLATLALVAYVTSAKQASQALDTQQDTAAAARARIDQLQARINELEATGRGNSAEIGELRTQVAALAEQIRQAGGKPVVTPTTQPAAAPPASTTTTTAPARPGPTTTTTAIPPQPCPTLPVLGVCRP